MPKYISTTEHAKSIRADIKAALKAGKLPAGLKVSVTTDQFSGGSAIRVYVRALPAGFELLNRARIEFELTHPHAGYWDLPHDARELHSEAARAVLATLNGIVDAYHEDNSTDDGGDKCWNVNFYKTVQFDTDVSIDARAALEAALRAAPAAAAPVVEVEPATTATTATAERVLISGRGARRWAARARRS